MLTLDWVKGTDPDVPITLVAALGEWARCDAHNVPDFDGFSVPLTANDRWTTVLVRNADTSLQAHTLLKLPCTATRGFERLGLAWPGNANENQVVTRERWISDNDRWR